MASELQAPAIVDLLRFYAEAGVDIAVSEAPVDRFAESRAVTDQAARNRPSEPLIGDGRIDGNAPVPQSAAPARPPASPPHMTTRAAPNLAVPSEAAVMAAREAASSAPTLEALRATLATFEGCNLRFTATNLVFADGNPQARVMFVGEAPGLEEDLQGLPFVGRSGQLLDRMLAAIGLDRTSAYIANVIPWRPPGNRDPSPTETEICRPFIERQIELVDPDFLITLGGSSARQLLNTAIGVTKIRGQWRAYQTRRREIRAMAMLHPAYLLRQPLQKRLAWRDLLALKRGLDGKA